MLPVASATLVSNLTASINDADHRWVVMRCDQVTSEEQRASASSTTYPLKGYNLLDPGPPPEYTEVVLQVPLESTSYSVRTTIKTTIELIGTKVRLDEDLVDQLELVYESFWVNGAFSSGVLKFNDGTGFVHANSTLDSAIRTKALALMTAREDLLEDTLAAGDGSADPVEMPSSLVTALKASLVDPEADWQVMAASTGVDPIRRITTFFAQFNSVKKRDRPGAESAPANFTFQAKINAALQLIDVVIWGGGTTWRTFDTELFGTVMALVADWRADNAENLEGGLG